MKPIPQFRFKQRRSQVAASLALTASLLATALVFGGTGYSLVASVIASGGEQLSSGPYTLNGTIAQPVIDQTLVPQEQNYRLHGGFWAESSARKNVLYLPLTKR